MRPPSAMIFAAGLGTRFKPWTDNHPKALAPINGRSLLQRNVEYLQQHGITDVVVNVHHFADQIVSAIEQNNGWGSHITISDERDAVLETGGGLKKAAPLFRDTTDPIVIINVDILTDLNLSVMLNAHKNYAPIATLAVTNRSTSRYFLFDENDMLTGWRNVTTGDEKIRRASQVVNQKAFSGIHVISPALLPLISQEGKFSIVDVYLSLAADYDIRAFDHSGSRFIDVGKPDSVQKAEQLFA